MIKVIKNCKLKLGCYFLYRDDCDPSYWMACKVVEVENGAYNSFYYYKVIKSSPSGEDVGSTSRFCSNSMFHMECTTIKSADDSSVFHCNCTKIAGIDDSYLLAMVI